MTGKPTKATGTRAPEPTGHDVAETLEQRVERLRRENEAMTLELENRMLRARLNGLPDIKEL